ncbi:MAG: ribosome small subunit-dependent GTPase A [Bacillota bacterium]
MPEGQVVRAHSSEFWVEAGPCVYQCSLRGRFRHTGEKVYAGDMVEFTALTPSGGVIDSILPRQSALTRPPVANVEQAVIVFTPAEPALDLTAVDRFLVSVARAGIRPALCLNKVDLIPLAHGEEIVAPYRRAGFAAVCASTRARLNIGGLAELLSGRLSVFAGLSGVGKSSLLNAVAPGLSLRTGALSAKVLRGTHTTRHVELLALPGGGRVVDTPGFSYVDLAGCPPEAVLAAYPEFDEFSLECRFSGCRHVNEPDCAVKAAVAVGRLDAGRHGRYKALLTEVLAERRY